MVGEKPIESAYTADFNAAALAGTLSKDISYLYSTGLET